jgi:hypothetical protein
MRTTETNPQTRTSGTTPTMRTLVASEAAAE